MTPGARAGAVRLPNGARRRRGRQPILRRTAPCRRNRPSVMTSRLARRAGTPNRWHEPQTGSDLERERVPRGPRDRASATPSWSRLALMGAQSAADRPPLSRDTQQRESGIAWAADIEGTADPAQGTSNPGSLHSARHRELSRVRFLAERLESVLEDPSTSRTRCQLPMVGRPGDDHRRTNAGFPRAGTGERTIQVDGVSQSD